MAFGLIHAHVTAMILSYMFFGSTGILFARYGRSLRFGNRRQFLGKALWFQIHRFLLSFTSLLTLLGFFFILVFANGKWVDPQISILHFVHSILGGIIVCCTILQVWLALYRCNPRSRYRYIFDWIHRSIGFLTFGLSVLNIFVMVIQLPFYRTALITITSIWIGWIIIAIIIFEKIESQQRVLVAPIANNGRGEDQNQNNNNTAAPPDIELGTNAIVVNRRLNLIRLFLILLHIIISIILSISFITIFCS